MKPRNLTTLIEKGGYAALIGLILVGLMLFASPASPANGEQPPRKRCTPVYKTEYNSAKRKNLLRNRNGMYLRTGSIWRRHYWYCYR